MSNEQFYHIPLLELFLTTELPVDMEFGDNPEFRTDLYKLCLAYYKEGWRDATANLESAVSELVYTTFPDDKEIWEK